LPIIVAESVVFYSAGSVMLFVPQQFADPTDVQCGLWTRAALEKMDRSFVVAMEQAFANGGESRAAAAASYAMNGKLRADELAIELAWRWFRDVRFEATAAEVRSRCPGVAPERVRSSFRRRLMAGFASNVGGNG